MVNSGVKAGDPGDYGVRVKAGVPLAA